MTQIGRTSARVSVTRDGAVPRRVTLSWAAISDTGNKRAGNEDSSISDLPIFAVADGMGGHSAGDVASAAVVDRLGEIRDAVTTADRIEGALAEALTDIDRVGDESALGTGTTVTGVALSEVDDDLAWMVFNIGDSRVYLLENGELQQLTVDHSVVQELIDAGLITPEQAERHPDSNVITRAVGFHEKPIPDYSTMPVVAGQRILVCSDGLTKELTDIGIRHYLSISPTADRAATELVAASLANGGRDNVTVVVVDVEADEVDGAVDSGAKDDAATDESTTDDAATDEAATDESATDEAATDEAATDEALTDGPAAADEHNADEHNADQHDDDRGDRGTQNP